MVKKSSKMAGKDGQMRPNAEMRPDSECMCTHMHGVLEGDGRWWWASNECVSLPKEGPLGPVLKQGHSRMWVMRWATASKCGDVIGSEHAWQHLGAGKLTKCRWKGCMVGT